MVPLSSGEIFRHEIETKTDLGNMAQRYIDRGELVPNGVTIEMMFKRIQAPGIIEKGKGAGKSLEFEEAGRRERQRDVPRFGKLGRNPAEIGEILSCVTL